MHPCCTNFLKMHNSIEIPQGHVIIHLSGDEAIHVRNEEWPKLCSASDCLTNPEFRGGPGDMPKSMRVRKLTIRRNAANEVLIYGRFQSYRDSRLGPRVIFAGAFF